VITLASNLALSQITVPFWVWASTIFDLRKRGMSRRESGAFLLGKQHGDVGRIRGHVCYDVLDPSAYQGGVIAFHASGYVALSRHCRERNLVVLADVHTHSGIDVGQSSVDQRHPMIPVIGHTAMILPNFGWTAWWSLKSAGVYEYLGNFRWRIHSARDGSRRVKISLWR
jgi:hypothetical protein